MVAVPPPSAEPKVVAMYDQTAQSYSDMMDVEIQRPTYTTCLRGLAEGISDVAGPVVDTSCGSGHLLERYRAEFDPQRPLLARDLSPQMVALSQARLGASVPVEKGDMRDLSTQPDRSLAAVVSFFALHHVSAEEARKAMVEWRRALRTGGQLLLGFWEGSGPIDYGDAADLTATLHAAADVKHWLDQAGYRIEWTDEHFEDDMGMNSLYLRASAVP